AIGYQQDHGATADCSPYPALVELVEALTDPGAAAPVNHPLRHPAEGGVGGPELELASDPGKSGGEHEHFDRGATSPDRMSKAEHEAAVPLHGSADIANQHEGAGTACPPQPLPS